MKNAYIPLPFPNFPTSTNATLFVKYIGRATHQIPYSTYSANRLTLIIARVSGKTSTTQIYVGGKGEPTAVYTVNGTLTWNYDASSMILTLNVAHESSTRTLIYWKLPGDVDGDGDVDRYDCGFFAFAYGTSIGHPRYDPRCDFDNDGDVDRYDGGILAQNYGKTA